MTQPLPEGRSVKITAKVTVAEFAALEGLAGAEDCTLSEVIRRALAAYGKAMEAVWQSRTSTGTGGGR